ncbi:MAG: rod shape-determining protein MreD [Candidatus Eremiobacteraeota bacterium]|nr:rod shape-determining protein MreD [Candidatus Eremiobacteraeota bacterium]
MLSSSRSSATPDTPYVGPAWWHAALVLLVALVFQLGVAHALTFRDAVPSAILVAAVWYAIRVDARRAAIFGLAAGLCEDLLSNGTGGAWTVSTTLVAAGVGFVSGNFFADSLPLAAIVAALATLLRNAIFWTMLGFEGYPPGLGGVHFHQTLWQALLDAALIVLAMLLARWRENYITR